MSTPPAVSVIIPAYNSARYLAATLRSVLEQTFTEFEVIVVDDGSADDSVAVVRQCDDRRVRLIEHGRNLGVQQARNTGIRAARGEVLAFLDSDDLFHRDKLQAHMSLRGARPDVGFTYNARFALHYSSEKIRGLWRPPAALALSDVLLGFPMAPSDMVVTKRWASEVGLWDEELFFYGAEYVFLGRLWLAGCPFASIDRALNYRRYHSGRRCADVEGACAAERAGQAKVFADPRMPDDVRRLRDIAFANTYAVWACHAFAQNETALGQQLLREAVRLDPAAIGSRRPPLLELLIDHATADEDVDHARWLANVFAQIPPEFASLSDRSAWAIATGYLWRGTRAVIWGEIDTGRRHFAEAAVRAAEIDKPFILKATHELLSYEAECGAAAADAVLRRLLPLLEQVGGAAARRAFDGSFTINRAFASYRGERYREVPARVMRAVARDPRYLLNRGVLSILVRSLAGLGRAG